MSLAHARKAAASIGKTLYEPATSSTQASISDETSKLLRDLVVVHDKLTRKGWEGVGALPSTVLAKAIRQADMLASEEPSAALEQLAEHLRLHHAAAVARDQAKRVSAMPRDDDGDAPHRIEVTEGSYIRGPGT